MGIRRSAPSVTDYAKDEENLDAAPPAASSPRGRRTPPAPPASEEPKSARRSADKRSITAQRGRDARNDPEDAPEEDQDSKPTRSSNVKRGWGAAKASQKEIEEGFRKDMKFDDDTQYLIKFLEDEPFAVYKQHFIRERKKGEKKSFICLEDACPLCDDALHKPDRKFAYNVLNFSAEDGERVECLIVGPRLQGKIQKAHEGNYGPIDKDYWSVERTGSNLTTDYILTSVKTRDITDDWGLEASDAKAALDAAVLYTEDDIKPSTKAELRSVAAELD